MVNRTIPVATRATIVPTLIATLGGAIVRLVRHRREQARQRRSLALLDDRMLRDIGLDRVDLAREIARPPWRW